MRKIGRFQLDENNEHNIKISKRTRQEKTHQCTMWKQAKLNVMELEQRN
jgi:hypothetical protein